jgi:hypothetical protein
MWIGFVWLRIGAFVNGFVSSGSITGEKALDSPNYCWVLRKYFAS